MCEGEIGSALDIGHFLLTPPLKPFTFNSYGFPADRIFYQVVEHIPLSLISLSLVINVALK